MHGTWTGTRVAAAIASLKDAGMTEADIARLAGVSRGTANRWARGANRPDHDPVQRLAARVWRDHSDVSRELVEASGYSWTEPSEDTAPPPLIAPEAEAAIRSAAESPEEAEELLAAMRKRRMEKLRATGGAPAA